MIDRGSIHCPACAVSYSAVDSNDFVLACADDRHECAGIAVDTDPVIVITNGHRTLTPQQCEALTGQRALITGAVYYLSAYKPGMLTRARPAVSGQWIVEIGRAIGMEMLQIEIKQIGRVPTWHPFRDVVFDPLVVEETPWLRSFGWVGAFTAVDDNGARVPGLSEPRNDEHALRLRGATDHLFYSNPDNQRPDAIARIVALGGNDGAAGNWVAVLDPWSTPTGGIAQLVDGSFISWFSFVDVTGSGFHGEAVGGDAEVFVSDSFRGAYMALSEQEREQFTYATSPDEREPVSVLHDRFLELGGVDDVDRRRVLHELDQLASTMGLFTGMVEQRVDCLVRYWTTYYSMIRQGEKWAEDGQP